jgi:hypothetical protein
VSPLRYELCFISQKAAFFIVTAVKMSNLTVMTLAVCYKARVLFPAGTDTVKLNLGSNTQVSNIYRDIAMKAAENQTKV